MFALVAILPALANAKWPDAKEGETFKHAILEVRPTQPAVGQMAVEEKVENLRRLSHDDQKAYLKKRPIPVVAAPNGRFYLIDHHHQTLAALYTGWTEAYYVLEKDYSELKNMSTFWARMKKKQWVRPFDHEGKPIVIPDGLPRSITDVADDPYRSLAYYVRNAGGYEKTSIEFAEFHWADFFRTRIRIWDSSADFNRALSDALALSHDPSASHLPGWEVSPLACKEWLRERIRNP